jgi:hypothetical protein
MSVKKSRAPVVARQFEDLPLGPDEASQDDPDPSEERQAPRERDETLRQQRND